MRLHGVSIKLLVVRYVRKIQVFGLFHPNPSTFMHLYAHDLHAGVLASSNDITSPHCQTILACNKITFFVIKCHFLRKDFRITHFITKFTEITIPFTSVKNTLLAQGL